MKRLIAIFFIIIFSATTEVGELLKLPFVFTHYYTHIQEGRSGNFFHFLQQHYLQNHQGDNDKTQDEQLPFKAAHADAPALVYLAVTTPKVNHLTPENTLLKFLQNSPCYGNACLKGIFHPPQFT